MNAHDLLNMPIVSVAEGTKLGNVRDLLFDTNQIQLTALLLSGESGQSIVLMHDILSIGSDVITVETSSKTQPIEGNATLQPLRTWRDISSLRAISSQGEWIGDITHIEVDPQSGAIIAISIQKGGVLGIGAKHTEIQPTAIRAFGPRVLTVKLAETDSETTSPPAGDQPSESTPP
ncbi:MAG: PRC-barrel domain-containing protein [Chloroflexi bacterium]|nr:PRC-barrel domain-containing protein [Chloroflexota bacterium]